MHIAVLGTKNIRKLTARFFGARRMHRSSLIGQSGNNRALTGKGLRNWECPDSSANLLYNPSSLCFLIFKIKVCISPSEEVIVLKTRVIDVSKSICLFVCLSKAPENETNRQVLFKIVESNLCPPGPISRHPSAQCARPPSHPSPGDEASRQKFRVGPLNCRTLKSCGPLMGNIEVYCPFCLPPAWLDPIAYARVRGGGSVGRRGCCKGDNKAQTRTLELHSSSFFSLSIISPNLCIN